ncbi:probable calcium-binding protein CML31 isoform X3 [Ananas comosus]|uniref:Probable calcium-binding protein CML31 isoform X1 n=1 Tax=Ananas comosus TaxID=4615 RepID=A0A6P5F1I5_ANACO|nr:probable calcium-binding protein CML31 isoform X1 [Ananas comosus]XP_020089976.1 probable calcium-binding protein CML31 isoform X2 [Ananas comosus]XP_020089977.1 probable calcium-binding protein CML31 isoform X3 [Ananas comosus]
MKENSLPLASTGSTATQKSRDAGASIFLFGWFCQLLSPAPPPPPPPPPPPSSRSDKPKQPMISSTHAALGASKSSDHDHLVLERIFRCFDENGDGKISSGELQRCMRAVGEELSCEEAEAAVRSTDWDGDGLIGFEDFVKLVESEGEEEKGRSLRGAFGVYEMEGEGCITPSSLRQALGRLGEARSIEDCSVMIRSFDLNGDGVLSFDEFRIMMLSPTKSDHMYV